LSLIAANYPKTCKDFFQIIINKIIMIISIV